MAAAAAFLERAAELSPDPAQRGTRALAAAQLKLDAGALEVAERLLTVAAASPLEELDSARAGRLRAQIAFARTRGCDTPSLLSAAATRLEPLDPELARETHLEALWAALRSGRFATAKRSWRLPRRRARPEPARAIDLLLDGVLARMTQRLRAGVAGGQRVRSPPSGPRGSGARTSRGAGSPASSRWTSGTTTPALRSAAGLGRVARESGGLTILPLALNYSAAHQLLLGEFGDRRAVGAGGGHDHRRDPGPDRRLLHPARRLARRSGDHVQRCVRPPSRWGRRTARRSPSRSPSGPSPSCTTASANTRTPRPPRDEPTTSTCSGSASGCCPSWSRQRCAAATGPQRRLAFARLAERRA